MRFRRWPVLVLPVGLLLVSCGTNLGRESPECDVPTNSLILSVQSVPGTAFAPCINGLKAGWEYEDLEAQSGQSIFSLDSDRLGGGGPGFEENPFLKVSLLPSCDVSEAIEVESDEPGVPLFVDVEVDRDVPITIVPDSRSLPTVIYADRLQRELDGTVISGRPVVVGIDRTFRDTKQRISEAQISGHAVVVVSARDEEDTTLTLLLPGSDIELIGLKVNTAPLSPAALDLGIVIDELEGVTAEASYVGSWYYPFAGGCVTYTFDAHGSGVSTIESDVQAALGLYDAEALRQEARDLGFDPG
jgi:hypothetical protein